MDGNAMDDEELLADEAHPDHESEDDLTNDARRVTEAVVTATDWTTETVLNQLERGNIQLNPRFQRRDAWTGVRKSKFIESLFLGLPIPQLVLAEQRGNRGSYIVIDGKQRLLALRQFAARHDDAEYEQLKLSRLEALPELNGETLERLQTAADKQGFLAAFENQTIRTMVVRNWPDEDFLYLLFLRLNTGSVPLSPQELRQALHPGPFMDFVEDASAGSKPIREALNIRRPDFRMRDVELLIRYFAFTAFIEDYDGNLKRSLDATCATLNAGWASRQQWIASEFAACELAIQTTLDIFGGNAFRRYSNGDWERRFNRAVFDAMVFFFRDPAVAASASKDRDAVVAAYKHLSTDDEFQESIQTTTKSVRATARRIAGWGVALQSVVPDQLPQIGELNGRITVS